MMVELLIAVIALILVLTLAYRRVWNRPHRVLSVALTSRGASGSWAGEIPADTIVMASYQLCLLWACKLRWLLNSEPQHTRPVLSGLVSKLATSLENGSAGDLDRDLAAQQPLLQALGMGGSPIAAVLDFDLYYTGKAPVYWFLKNSLPAGSTHGDWIWSVAHLVRSATRDLDPANTKIFGVGLAHLARMFEAPEADDPSVAALHRMFAEANSVGIASTLEAIQPR